MYPKFCQGTSESTPITAMEGGEFVNIVTLVQGKSTVMMNIIGCLQIPRMKKRIYSEIAYRMTIFKAEHERDQRKQKNRFISRTLIFYFEKLRAEKENVELPP